MAAEESSSTNQQLTLDHLSFEKLLAAAWVLQCVHDQMQAPIGRRPNDFESVGKVNKFAQSESSVLQSGFQFSADVTQADSRSEVPTGQPVNHGALANPVEIDQSAINGLVREATVDIQNSVHRDRSSFSGDLRRVPIPLRGLRAVGIQLRFGCCRWSLPCCLWKRGIMSRHTMYKPHAQPLRSP